MDIYPGTEHSFLSLDMKIGFFNHSLRMGSGIDTVITELATRLAKTEEVEVVCFNTDYKKDNYNFKITEVKSQLLSNQLMIYAVAPFVLDKLGRTEILE